MLAISVFPPATSDLAPRARDTGRAILGRLFHLLVVSGRAREDNRMKAARSDFGNSIIACVNQNL